MAILAGLIPALISGGLGVASALTAKKPSLKEVPTMSKQQSALQNQLLGLISGQFSPSGGFGQAQSYLQKQLQGAPETRQPFEDQAIREFRESIVPRLAEQFAGLGATSSSGFQQALGAAGAGLAENLAGIRTGLQSGAASQLLGIPGQFLGAGFQSPFALMQRPGGGVLSNALGGFGSGVAPGLGQISSLMLLKNFFPSAFGGK